MGPKSRAANGISRANCPCTRCAQILITALRKRGRHSVRSESRSGSIEARFSILAPRWRGAPARIRSMKLGWASASGDHEHVVSAKVVKAPRAEDREERTLRDS